MSYAQLQRCIDACNACAIACDHCADACLHGTNVYAMRDCISLNIDSGEICRLAAGYVARGSKTTALVCETCADICERCQEECDKYQLDHCKACSEACRVCVEECRATASSTSIHRHRSSSAIVAGMRQ